MLITGISCTPGEYASFLIASMTIGVVVALSAHVGELIRETKELEATLRAGRQVTDLPQRISRMWERFIKVNDVAKELEKGFSYVMT